MISRVGISSVLAVACVATMTACGSEETSAAEPDAPRVSEILYTTVWSADPGIDLFGRGAELIRATEEAASYTYLAGPSATYPGYLGAVRNSDIGLSPDDPDFRTDGGWSRAVVYTRFQHIVDFSADSHTVSAIVCDYGIRDKSPDPRVPWIFSVRRGLF